MIGFYLITGIVLGNVCMYLIQKKARQSELERLSESLQKLLDGKELDSKTNAEETLISKINHQLLRIQFLFTGQRNRAQQERKELQELISEIAHQMRTPLTNLKNYLDILEEELDADNSIKLYLNALRSSEEKLSFLTEHFIRISRLEHGIIQIRKEKLDYLQTLRNALGQVLNQAEQKRIDFHFDLPKEATAPHDAGWLWEAVYNLLDNAVKYNTSGGTIEVSLKEEDLFLTLRIRDYGIGIEPDEENRIFQRFYRGHRVTTQEGFGIGLYLAREIVSQHGGILTVKRKEPGVEMRLSIPRT